MGELSTSVENELRGVERELEKIGRKICSANGGMSTWTDINRALDSVRNAIRNAYLIDDI